MVHDNPMENMGKRFRIMIVGQNSYRNCGGMSQRRHPVSRNSRDSEPSS
jgi:hypothetical protein